MPTKGYSHSILIRLNISPRRLIQDRMETTYYQKNREKCLQQAKEYLFSHKEHYRQYNREYYHLNKEKILARNKERRQRLRQLELQLQRKTAKKVGRPRKPIVERILQYSPPALSPTEPIEEPQVVFYSEKDFVVSFD